MKDLSRISATGFRLFLVELPLDVSSPSTGSIEQSFILFERCERREETACHVANGAFCTVFWWCLKTKLVAETCMAQHVYRLDPTGEFSAISISKDFLTYPHLIIICKKVFDQFSTLSAAPRLVGTLS